MTEVDLREPVSPKIDRLLVANRGEIACRVFRTAKAMGITTIAVFSDPDRDALHTRSADIAVSIGGTTSAESYLDVALILDAALRSGADAIHPGYGFLSENPDFAQAVLDAGLIWVGPSPESIRAMAHKVEAKRIAATSGVPLVPGAELAAVASDTELLAAADEVGYPLLVKASAGGGGKGMRLVESRPGLLSALAAARREAQSSFGDPTVFLERALVGARHVEVQVFGDAHGNVVHMYERECSIQRRHQKIIEESPSPGTTPQTLDRMYASAVGLTEAIGYVGAGTVEFLVAGSGDFQEYFFLEMNTRLQVEHPVTEETIPGLDLVEWQLRVALGEPLPRAQRDIVRRGHAIEVRLYAEDPSRDYLPSVGKVVAFAAGGADLLTGAFREELSIVAGDEVTQYYDPMIAKIIVAGVDRNSATRAMAATLKARDIAGIITNRDSLVAILESEFFLSGNTTTDFLELHPELLVRPVDHAVRARHLVAATVAAAERDRAGARWRGLASTGWRNIAALPARADWEYQHDGSSEHAAILIDWIDDESGVVSEVQAATGVPLASAGLTGAVTGHPFRARITHPTHDLPLSVKLWSGLTPQNRPQLHTQRLEAAGVHAVVVALELDGVMRSHVVGFADGWVWVNDGSISTTFRQLSRFADASHGSHGGGPSAPLPGTVVAIEVTVGDEVLEGQTLVILEAMKMEHRIKADAAGIVTQVMVVTGQSVDAHQVLVTVVANLQSDDDPTSTGAIDE